MQTFEKNLYGNNNYKLLKKLIALNNKHLYDMRLLLLGCTGFVGKEMIKEAKGIQSKMATEKNK